MGKGRILLVDLNNFARYPTIPVGYLAALLRRESMLVKVFSPLATGVTGVVREPRVPLWGYWTERLRYWSAMSRRPWVRSTREWLTQTALHAPKLARQTDYVANGVEQCLKNGTFDAVMVSTYLMYRGLCGRIGELCQRHRLPLLVGGPYFAQPEVRRAWIGLPGVTGLVGGEVEPYLGEITRGMIANESLDRFPGVWTEDPEKANAPPLQDLDSVPFPDFSDFPWDRYPNRIIPLTTGRGCSWGACTFCSDVTGSAGRTYRSRSPSNVLAELEYQSSRFGTELFVFTDPKLNSNAQMWDVLLTKVPVQFPSARWIGALHIDSTRSDELDRASLRAARRAGMVRLTTGLESGSQRVLDRMKKGTQLDVTSRVIRDAAAEGISVRTTMIVGYPGEQADDVQLTARFLEDHSDSIERVVLNRFHIRTGTRIDRAIRRRPQLFPDVLNLHERDEMSLVEHEFVGTRDPAYRRGIARVLQAAHRINRRPLRDTARQFDGVM